MLNLKTGQNIQQQSQKHGLTKINSGFYQFQPKHGKGRELSGLQEERRRAQDTRSMIMRSTHLTFVLGSNPSKVQTHGMS